MENYVRLMDNRTKNIEHVEIAQKVNRLKGLARKAMITATAAVVLSPVIMEKPLFPMRSLEIEKAMPEAAMVAYSLTPDHKIYADFSKPIDIAFVAQASIEANWVAKELNLPKAFIMEHWAMESGRFSHTSGNNIAGIMKRGHLVEFDSLHDFAHAYVATLKKDGIRDMDEPWKIIDKLHEKHYVVGETASTYGLKIDHIAGELKDVGPEYSSFHLKFKKSGAALRK
jgi:hypothetical protein